MSDSRNQFEQTLKQAGFSMTKPRTLVFLALAKHQRLSMAALCKVCNELDRATVYRTIALFEQLGVVQRIQQGWKYQLELSAMYSHHHHHLICTSCGSIQEIHEDAQLESQIEGLALAKDFLPQDHQIEIRGLCKECRATT